ncbi:MAG: internalin [Myxococcaceae bacterium]|nr:internalin [Myxococcaceae bacterium]
MHERASLKRVLYAGVMSMLAATCLPGSADAQSFRLDRFRSAERPDDAFGVRRMGLFGHLRFGANAVADYANDPLVVKKNPNSNDQLQSIVKHELVLKVDLSLALYDRLILLAGFDAPLVLKGPSVRPGLNVARADGAGFGDVSLGARARLIGDRSDVFALGLQAVVIVPTAGNHQTYRGENAVAVRPELIAEVRTKPVRITGNVGALGRKKVAVVDRALGSELNYGLAVGVPVHPRIELLAELSGGFDLNHFAAKTSTGVEWLAGGKANTTSGFYFGAAAGTGFTRGIGTPDARVIGQLGYLAPIKQQKAKEQQAPVDRDHDGILDDVDQCPDQAEDRDGFADEDGCPDLDNDGDSVPDASDSCANNAEDRDGFADEDGCPDPDNDADGIADVDDACPNEPGPTETRGCKQVQTEDSLMQLEQVQFENNRDTILEQSFPVLETVRSALEKHPEITKLRVEGHTDGVGAAAYNMRLSRNRTASVAAWLTAHGVDKKRLEAYGCGELHTIADDATAEGRAKNRRVEFQIIEPASGAATAKKQGCTKVELK